MPRAAKSFFKFLILVIAICLIGNIGYSVYKKWKNGEPVLNKTEEIAYDTGLNDVILDEMLSNVNSDIEGMTQLDKKNMGLLIWDGADSDCDGLSDKEEIEVYGTDPLKCSTSGDMYSDGYKVSHGMDVNTYYEYEGVYSPKLDESNGAVILTPAVPTDELACVKEKTRVEAGYEIYKSYWIQSFGGNVSIDITDILSEHDISMKDIVVLKNTSNILQSDVKEYAVEKDGNTIIIPEKCNMTDSYLFCIATKKSFTDNAKDKLSSFIDTTFDSFSVTVDGNDKVKADVIMFGSPIATAVSGKKALELWYVDTGDAYINQQEINVLLSTTDYYSTVFFKTPVKYTAEDCTPKTYREVQDKIKSLSKLKYFNVVNGKEGLGYFLQGFYVYGTLSDLAENIEVVDNNVHVWDESERISAFNDEEETFPFSNFRSYIGTGGNCAGIAYLTAVLHNGGEVPATFTYESIAGKGTYSYDISGFEETATLMDYGLNDYESYDWLPYNEEWYDSNGDGKNDKFKIKKQVVDEEYYQNSLTDSQRAFVDMIGLYWRGVNDFLHDEIFATAGRNGGYDYSMIEDMKTSLDNGQILILGYSTQGGISKGHCINITGYKEDENDSDVTYFYVYDNNYVYNSKTGYGCDNFVTVTRVESPYYVDGTFSWSYYPSKTSECWGTSASDRFCFVVMDDYLKLYNTSFFKANSDVMFK